MPPTNLVTVNPDGNNLALYVAAAVKAVLAFTGIINEHNTTGEINIPVIVGTEIRPGYHSGTGTGTGSVTVRYTDEEGHPHTQVVPINEDKFYPLDQQSVQYEVKLTTEEHTIQDSIHDTGNYIGSTSAYASFFDEDKINIIHDGLMKIFNRTDPPKVGFIHIVEGILKTMNLNNTDDSYRQIIENVNKDMGDFRFVEFNGKTANRAARVANILKLLYDNTGTHVTIDKDLIKEGIHDIVILIGDFIHQVIRHNTPKMGGQRSKQSYNYAHFIPLNPNSKKSFHNGISRKVKSRRRKQYRNKHTMRRK
jgi:hypothetical protein